MLSVAILASTVGSVFAIFGDTIVGAIFGHQSGLSLGWTDAAGLALAFLSFVCISLVTVTIRAIGDHPSGKTPDPIVVFYVNLGCVLGALPTFVIDIDDWYVVSVSLYSCVLLFSL